MLIGDSVTYNRRSHVVIGFATVSAAPVIIELRDARAGATFWPEQRLVTELVAPERAAVRSFDSET